MVHDAEIDLIPEGFIEIANDPFAIFFVSGEAKVPDNHAPSHQRTFVGSQIVIRSGGQKSLVAGAFLIRAPLLSVCEKRGTRLSHHFLKRLLAIGKIVRCAGILLRKERRDIFAVREIDIDKPLQPFERFHGFIAAGIVDDGDPKPLRPGKVQGGNDLRQEVYSGDEVDVVRSFRLQTQEDVGQLFGAERLLRPSGGDFSVLAKNAA